MYKIYSLKIRVHPHANCIYLSCICYSTRTLGLILSGLSLTGRFVEKDVRMVLGRASLTLLDLREWMKHCYWVVKGEIVFFLFLNKKTLGDFYCVTNKPY